MDWKTPGIEETGEVVSGKSDWVRSLLVTEGLGLTGLNRMSKRCSQSASGLIQFVVIFRSHSINFQN